MNELILIVEDEENIIQLAQLYLEQDGFKVESVNDGSSALQVVEDINPALIILDIMLPGIDGYEICRRLRTNNITIPIIMLTARDDDIDKILGLELGADDYLSKPFNPRELVARVKAILRRGAYEAADKSRIITISDLAIDLARREVKWAGNNVVDLRVQEFELLSVLAINKGIVLSREKLLSLAWGYDFYGQTRTVDVHIASIRKKLSAAGCAIQIETVTGIGYKLKA